MLNTEKRFGMISAARLFFIPNFIISIYHGVRPPEKSVVKYIKYEILFRHGKSFLCKTYAVIAVKKSEITVPTTVMKIVTAYEFTILCGFSKIVLYALTENSFGISE